MSKINIGGLFGDKKLDNVISRVDTLIDELTKNKINSKNQQSNNIADNALKEFIMAINDQQPSSNGTLNDSSKIDPSIQSLLDKLAVSPDRLSRYYTYDEIYRTVQLVKRIIGVYINNCLQRDVLSGKCLMVKQNKNISQIKGKEEANKFTESCLKKFNLETKLSDVVLQHLLRYGDHFIEIVDLEDISNDVLPSDSSNSVVFENIISTGEKLLNNNNNKYIFSPLYNEFINNISETFFEVVDYQSTIDPAIFIEKKIYEENINIADKNKYNLNRIYLKYHKPHNICVLNIEDNIIGYVEVRDVISMNKTLGVGARFATMVNQINLLQGNKEIGNESVTKEIINRIVSKIIKKISGNVEINSNLSNAELNKKYEELIKKSLGDDLLYFIKTLIFNTKEGGPLNKLLVRFIPPSRMVRITYNPIEYFPYGTSVIDSLVYPGKLYLLNQLVNTVSKLSRAALVRKWTVETGPREYHSNQIQKLKRELKNQRVTVDDLLSFKSIPKILSDFKDVIIISKKGQKFVDFELQSMHDSNIKIADLEDLRRELIALSGVPAPYLGYNDVVELREQLVHVNVTFATEIISIQTQINGALTKLVDRIAEIIEFPYEPSEFNTISLKLPVVLLLQMLETIMSSISNIQQNFQSTQVVFDPIYLLRMYIPSIDWDDFLRAGREYALLQKANTPMDDTGGGMQ